MPIDEIAGLIGRFCSEGRCETPVPRLMLVSSQIRTLPVPSVYQPLFCLVAQGAKRVVVGERIVHYSAGSYVVVSLDLPVCGEICEASQATPYLALTLQLTPALIAEVLMELAAKAAAEADAPALGVSRATPEIADTVLRLLRLLERPDDIPFLAPMIERELIYRLMQGEQGPVLRQIALADSRLSQIARAIDRIKHDFDRPLRIETLADVANMSVSSFHRHFKAVTAMSPLQYQKQIRLHEARRLLMAQSEEAGRVGFAVGYESPSQFSREYVRMFGMPPARDAARLRSLPPTDPGRMGDILEAQG